MVMIEALARGVPVVTCPTGLRPRSWIDGVTGIVCDHPSELPAAITAARRLSAAECRARVENCFDAATMVHGYESVYREVLRARLPIRRSGVLLPVGRRPRTTPTVATA